MYVQEIFTLVLLVTSQLCSSQDYLATRGSDLVLNGDKVRQLEALICDGTTSGRTTINRTTVR